MCTSKNMRFNIYFTPIFVYGPKHVYVHFFTSISLLPDILEAHFLRQKTYTIFHIHFLTSILLPPLFLRCLLPQKSLNNLIRPLTSQKIFISFFIEQLQGIPFFGIVTGSEYNSPLCFVANNLQFYCWCC